MNDNLSESEPIMDNPPWIDLSQYNSKFDRGKPQWMIFLWWLIEGVIFPLTPHNLNGFRSSLLRLFGAKIGKGVVIRPTVKIYFPWKVEIGDYSWVGDQVYLYSLDYIKIGCHTVISQKSYLCTGSHNFDDVKFPLITNPITIGNGVWIATDCFIAPDVKIGANTLIGARSSVFKSISSESIAWGNPCKPRQSRNFSEIN
ncbi:WcaF family extracellular polysaccharide biosynthesis acetyltransferase [Geminocystis herdmanii]|uniref:WcaF family extracellular polysaccharide biosynthesis acetyltransferase n=1 Tax=Geminocystis herdmanii TaxID=669359 RepID=UPI000344B5BE|nr:WcaF family extracellular polysaccharide biosynthesis acetyltransferase [Geminocystis herdmanii]